jgi:predicted AlkP superfamily phosphohydrolase/phosphomutase
MDYERTHVYLGASYSGLLYFNLEGREPFGVVSIPDRPKLAAELIENLSQISDPETGQPLITHVYQSEDLYEGPAAKYSPDLILDTYESGCNVLTNFRRGSMAEERQGQYFVHDQKEFGRHSRDGIFVFSGSDFKTGSASGQGHVMDLPATLLHLHGVPIPEDYDGHILTELLKPEFVRQHRVCYQSGDTEVSGVSESPYSAEETEELISHLQALGYLE